MTTRVRDLMSRDVAVIESGREVQELERLLLQRGVHGMPVVDELGRIVGVVSQTDLLAWHFEAEADGRAFYDRPDERRLDSPGQPPLRLTGARTASVGEIMSPVIHCIGPDREIAEAAARMVRERIHRLVVVDERYAVLGILSATDVLKAVPGVEARLAASA